MAVKKTKFPLDKKGRNRSPWWVCQDEPQLPLSPMNWPLSILVGFLSGIAGLFSAGWAASLHGGWHQVSTREGNLGYFIILMALLGGIAFFIAGLVIARILAAGGEAGFVKTLGLALALVVVITGAAMGLSRVTADIPPTREGRGLVLEVEFRLPEGAVSPGELAGDPRCELGVVSGGVRRSSQWGRLRPDLAREEEGRWIVPATFDLYTSSPDRIIDASIGEVDLGKFLVPMPSRPGAEFETWSSWKPQPREGDPVWPPTKPSFRFRVVKQSEP